MTGCTPFNIWLVKKIPHQSLAIASVWVVTGEAVFEGQGIVLMGCLQCICGVAGIAEGIGFVRQQLQVIGLV